MSTYATLSTELQSLDHAASVPFLHADVAFQSPKLPPSNAVIATSPSLNGYYPGRKGVTRFPFKFLLPANAPSSCSFQGNAAVTYTLLGTVSIQYQGERSILFARLDFPVVEAWHDWQLPRWHEASEAQKREKFGALSGHEGSVWVEAKIPDPFYFRGWQTPEGVLQRDRARGEVGVRLSVKNGTNRTVSRTRWYGQEHGS